MFVHCCVRYTRHPVLCQIHTLYVYNATNRVLEEANKRQIHGLSIFDTEACHDARKLVG